MSDAVRISSARGDDLFSVVARNHRAGWPNWANLQFTPKNTSADDYGGGGVYAIAYRNQLLYVGKFTGSAGIPFGGNVVKERLWKHLEALTMRGRSIGFSAKNYDLVTQMPDGPIVSGVRRHPTLRGYDRVRTYPCKVAFATEHWTDFQELETPRSTLREFRFVYGRAKASKFDATTDYAALKKYIGVIEDDLILELSPRCNVLSHRSPRTHLVVGPDADEWDEFKQLVRAFRRTCSEDETGR